MKIRFKEWNWLNGRIIRTVYVRKTKDGYWSKNSQRALIAVMKETKGIEIEEAEKDKVAQHAV